MTNNQQIGIIAIFFGGLGAHKFIQKRYVTGFIYLLFCRTYIPAILGLIDGIVLLTKKD